MSRPKWYRCPDCKRRFRKLGHVLVSDLGSAQSRSCKCGTMILIQHGKIVEAMRPVSEAKSDEIMRAVEKMLAKEDAHG